MKENLKKVVLFLIPMLTLLGLNHYIETQGESYISYLGIIVLYCIAMLLVSNKNKYFCIEKVHKVRYYIATILFIILVVFKFHGSSIGMWDYLYKDYGDETVQTKIYEGTPRSIRSDEWLVQTPLYLSQVMKEDKLTRINENMRSNGEDMVVASYSPVLDATILGKPFSWGFLFLDKERGFSWYWWLKVISLFMVSYEMALMLSKRNKKIALFGASCIAFSPGIQWWFSTFVADLIIFAQGALVATYYYFRSKEDIKKKIINLIIFTICGIGFVISLYPAIQVCLGYLCAIIFIYLIVKNKEKIKKKDILYFSVSVFVILSVIAYFIFTAREALSLMLGTTYPGARVELGGNSELYLLSSYAFSWLLPYKDPQMLNASELSSFISLIPLTLIIFFFRKRDDEDNKLMVSMYIYMIIMLIFVVFGFPEILAKITLFSYIPVLRLLLVVGLTSTYLLIMILSNIVQRENKINIVISSVITIASIIIIYLPLYGSEGHKYLHKEGVLIGMLVFAILIYLFVRGYTKNLLPYVMVFMIIAGFFVNPISRTLAPIYEKEVCKNIVKINKEDPGKWVSINNLYGASLLIANGVEVFNGVHYYPDLNMWRTLDTENIYEDIYNRYAHVLFDITNEETKFELVQVDTIKVSVSIKDLYKTGIKYLLSNEDLCEYNTSEKINFKELYYNVVDDTYIYEIVQ